MQVALLENLQRENLSAIEEAIAYKSMIEKLSLTQEELSKKVGKSRSHITNILGLLRLPNEVQKMVANNQISMGHARVLSKLEDENLIKELAKKIKEEHMSVRELELIVSNPDYKRKNPIQKVKEENKFGFVEETMTDRIGNRVRIKNKKIITINVMITIK